MQELGKFNFKIKVMPNHMHMSIWALVSITSYVLLAASNL